MFLFSSSTVILLRMTLHPTMWILCSSPKSPPAVPWRRRQLSCPLCPLHPPSLDWIVPCWRWPTQTAPAVSCLRCDESGATINCGARVLFSLPFSFRSFRICFCCICWPICHLDKRSATFRGFWTGWSKSAGSEGLSGCCRVKIYICACVHVCVCCFCCFLLFLCYFALHGCWSLNCVALAALIVVGLDCMILGMVKKLKLTSGQLLLLTSPHLQ